VPQFCGVGWLPVTANTAGPAVNFCIEDKPAWHRSRDLTSWRRVRRAWAAGSRRVVVVPVMGGPLGRLARIRMRQSATPCGVAVDCGGWSVTARMDEGVYKALLTERLRLTLVAFRA